MGRYYKLNRDCLLRGYDDQPYVLWDMRGLKSKLLSEQAFCALSFCDGSVDFDGPVPLAQHMRHIEKYLGKGVVEPCRRGEGIRDIQKYYLAPNRFIDSTVWAITGKCNMSCRHCMMSAPRAKYGEPSHEQCLEIIRQLGRAGVTNVSLTGGEPLVREDLFELIDAMLSEGIYPLRINTNGALVTQSFLDGLKSRGLNVKFVISFDGVGWHDWMRGVPGAEQKAVDAIRQISANGFRVYISSTFHSESLSSLLPTFRLLTGLGVFRWRVGTAGYMGDWKETGGRYNPTLDEMIEALLGFIPEYFEAGAPFTLMFGSYFSCGKGGGDYRLPQNAYDGTEAALDCPVCGFLERGCYIDPRNRLGSCMTLPVEIFEDGLPDLMEIPFGEALSNPSFRSVCGMKVAEYLRLDKKCASCGRKLTCAGGCRKAAVLSGNLRRKDGVCEFFDKGYDLRVLEAAEAACKQNSLIKV